MDDKERNRFLSRLFATQGGKLRAFIHGRIRNKHDTADVAQETFLRISRVADLDLIRDPNAYLFTIAANVIKENRISDRRATLAVRIDDEDVHQQLGELPDVEGDLDRDSRVRRLQEVLPQLPTKCHATIVLQYGRGASYQEIADALGISTHTVKKYHSQALAFCARRMSRLR
jgi:RNA polymerase sigma factor (sigma-70 family)